MNKDKEFIYTKEKWVIEKVKKYFIEKGCLLKNISIDVPLIEEGLIEEIDLIAFKWDLERKFQITDNCLGCSQDKYERWETIRSIAQKIIKCI